LFNESPRVVVMFHDRAGGASGGLLEPLGSACSVLVTPGPRLWKGMHSGPRVPLVVFICCSPAQFLRVADDEVASSKQRRPLDRLRLRPAVVEGPARRSNRSVDITSGGECSGSSPVTSALTPPSQKASARRASTGARVALSTVPSSRDHRRAHINPDRATAVARASAVAFVPASLPAVIASRTEVAAGYSW
jgi:hypothetical protein